jgi:hypothetical protein
MGLVNWINRLLKKPQTRKLHLFLLIVILALASLEQYQFFTYIHFFSNDESTVVHKKIPIQHAEFSAYSGPGEKNDEYIKIVGWARFSNKKSSLLKMYVVLLSENDTIVITTRPREQLDVANFFGTYRFLFSGFELLLPNHKVNRGVYQIGFLGETSDTTVFKLSDLLIDLTAPASTDIPITNWRDEISISDAYWQQKVKPHLKSRNLVGYVGDSSLSNELRFREAQYSLAPTIVSLNNIEIDTLIGFFPNTKNLQNPKNPLYRQRGEWDVLEEIGNGISILVKNNSLK